MQAGCLRIYPSHVRRLFGRDALQNMFSVLAYSPNRHHPSSNCIRTFTSRVSLGHSAHILAGGLLHKYSSQLKLCHVRALARRISWTLKLQPRPADPETMSNKQEDAAKATILEKVMKGRQPTDLMLRCEQLPAVH